MWVWERQVAVITDEDGVAAPNHNVFGQILDLIVTEQVEFVENIPQASLHHSTPLYTTLHHSTPLYTASHPTAPTQRHDRPWMW